VQSDKASTVEARLTRLEKENQQLKDQQATLATKNQQLEDQQVTLATENQQLKDQCSALSHHLSKKEGKNVWS
jgi:uncharacterized coiled-coil protein SlyX